MIRFILSNKWDLTVDFVVRELRQRKHEFLRLNSEDLRLGRASTTLPEFRIYISSRGQQIELSNARVVWNRRPGKPFDDVPAASRPSAGIQRYVNDQWYSWLESLQLLPNVVWINHPQRNDAMESKLRQLTLARQAGFSYSDTCVSNDSDTIKEFQRAHQGRNCIVKALYSPLIEEPDQDHFIFTNELPEISEEDNEQIRICPTIVQESLVPKVDYRVTVVGNNVYAVRIESEADKLVALDWRTQKDGLRFSRSQLPERIETLCRALRQERRFILWCNRLN